MHFEMEERRKNERTTEDKRAKTHKDVYLPSTFRITSPDEYYINILLSYEQKGPYFQRTYKVIVYLDLMTTATSNTPLHSWITN